MNKSEMIALIESYWACEAEKDVDGILEHYASDGKYEAPIVPEVMQGQEKLREIYTQICNADNSSSVEITNAVREGDTLAVEWTFRAIAPDGNEVCEAHGGTFFVIRDGKIHSLRAYFNPADFSD